MRSISNRSNAFASWTGPALRGRRQALSGCLLRSILVALVALALMGLAYGVTAFVSAPLHGRMSERFDARLHARLVSTNWIRTAAWSARGLLLAVLAFTAIT